MTNNDPRDFLSQSIEVRESTFGMSNIGAGRELMADSAILALQSIAASLINLTDTGKQTDGRE